MTRAELQFLVKECIGDYARRETAQKARLRSVFSFPSKRLWGFSSSQFALGSWSGRCVPADGSHAYSPTHGPDNPSRVAGREKSRFCKARHIVVLRFGVHHCVLELRDLPNSVALHHGERTPGLCVPGPRV